MRTKMRNRRKLRVRPREWIMSWSETTGVWENGEGEPFFPDGFEKTERKTRTWYSQSGPIAHLKCTPVKKLGDSEL